MRKEKEIYEVVKEEEGIVRVTQKERECSVYRLVELSQEQQDYIMKHINKAQDILRKTALRYARTSFIDLGEVFIFVDDSYAHRACVKECKDGIIKLNINKDFLEHMYKRKYNKKLLETLMHEMIHIFCKDWYKRDYDWSHDSSFVFCTIVNWFNHQFNGKYHIGLNGTLERDYKFNQSFLKDKINNGISFEELRVLLYGMVIETENELKDTLEELVSKERYNADGIRQLTLLLMDYESESFTRCEVEYIKLPVNGEEIIVEVNNIYLAQDVNCKVEEDEYSIKNLIKYMLDEEYCEERTYLNDIEDLM